MTEDGQDFSWEEYDAYRTVFALVSAGSRGLRWLRSAAAISDLPTTFTTTSLARRWLYAPSLTSHDNHGIATLRQATKPSRTKDRDVEGKIRNAESVLGLQGTLINVSFICFGAHEHDATTLHLISIFRRAVSPVAVAAAGGGPP
jgi:hypothetical protein